MIETISGRVDAALLDHRPQGEAAKGWVLKLRKHLEGSKVESLRRDHRTIELIVKRGGKSTQLIAVPAGLLLFDDTKRAIVSSKPGLERRTIYTDKLLELEPKALAAETPHFYKIMKNGWPMQPIPTKNPSEK